jgi:hypothetical protein
MEGFIMCNVTLNNELKGIELSFTSKPEESILAAIKSNGFRWHNVKKIWYAKQSKERLQFANTLKETELQPTTEVKQPTKKEEKKIVSSLWDRVQFTKGDTDTSKYNYRYVGSNYNKYTNTKEMLVTIRKHVKERFPECKFSIRLGKSGYTDSVNFDIISSPYAEDSIYLKAIQSYCTKLLKSYNFDDSDSMTDYFHVNFYGDRADISYKYTQTEQTEDIKNDILNYDKQQELFEIAEEERKEKEYQEYLIKQDEDNKAYKIRQQEEVRQKEEINNTIDIKELTEDQKYFVIGSQFAHLNKNNTLDQYKEEIKADEFYLQNVEITKEVHFQTAETLEYFNNMLLHDFDFIEGTGGSRTDDYRIQSMTDYYNMDEEERKTVEFYSCDCIAVYYNNQLQFVIDAQGYSYSRYVGLCDNVTIQKKYNSKQVLTLEQVEEYKQQAETLEDISTEVIADNNIINTWQNENWITYKEAFKEKLKKCTFRLNKNIIQQLPEESESLKVAMYKLLKEVDGIQEQFKDADLQHGQKVTLFYIGGMGGLITSHITIDKVENSKYAQYDNAVKITFKQPRKHGLYYKYFYSDMLVYDGWIDIPKTVLYDIKEQNGFIVTSGKYSSYDKKAYDAIIDYLLEQNIKPIVNTYKPIF